MIVGPVGVKVFIGYVRQLSEEDGDLDISALLRGRSFEGRGARHDDYLGCFRGHCSSVQPNNTTGVTRGRVEWSFMSVILNEAQRAHHCAGSSRDRRGVPNTTSQPRNGDVSRLTRSVDLTACRKSQPGMLWGSRR